MDLDSKVFTFSIPYANNDREVLYTETSV